MITWRISAFFDLAQQLGWRRGHSDTFRLVTLVTMVLLMPGQHSIATASVADAARDWRGTLGSTCVGRESKYHKLLSLRG